MDILNTTRQFWDANPCGIHAEYELQRNYKYTAEPWLIPVLTRIGKEHSGQKLLEIGCGQGIDATVLPNSIDYVGIDYSPESVAVAQKNAALLGLSLRYEVGNAEQLHFPDDSFDVVYSCGVIHHTADVHRAIAEVRRVLKSGGTAWIALYATSAPKVFIALGLRKIQSFVDFVLGTDRAFYQFIKRYGSYLGPFGTMFHECFGVPYLKAYTKKQIEELFVDFSNVKIERYGSNLKLVASPNENPRGYIWQVIAKK